MRAVEENNGGGTSFNVVVSIIESCDNERVICDR